MIEYQTALLLVQHIRGKERMQLNCQYTLLIFGLSNHASLCRLSPLHWLGIVNLYLSLVYVSLLGPNINMKLLERTEATNKETLGKGQKCLRWGGLFSGRPGKHAASKSDCSPGACILGTKYYWQQLSGVCVPSLKVAVISKHIKNWEEKGRKKYTWGLFQWRQ